MQYLFAGVGDQYELALHYPDELILMGMPVTLAGPRTRFDDGQIDAEQGQPRVARQSLAGLSTAGGVEGARIAAASLRGHGGKVDLFHIAGPHKRCEILSGIPHTGKGRLWVWCPAPQRWPFARAAMQGISGDANFVTPRTLLPAAPCTTSNAFRLE